MIENEKVLIHADDARREILREAPELAYIIDRIKPADAVEIVRCKDCKYQQKVWHQDKRMISKGYYLYWCDRNEDPFVSHTVNGCDDEFCSYGERKDDD